MQIRFGEKPHNYDANHFIYEIARSEMTLEITQSLHKKAISLSESDKMINDAFIKFKRLN